MIQVELLKLIQIVCINYNLDPVKYIEVTQGYRTLSSAGIFPELFRASGPSSTTIYSYIIAVWNMLISLRNMEDPLWNEFAGQLLAFVVSQNNDTFNKWLLRDLLVLFLFFKKKQSNNCYYHINVFFL